MLIANESLVARRGEEHRDLVIRVHLPEPSQNFENDTTYQTLVEMQGFEPPRTIYGEGSLQSLALAFRLIRGCLDTMASQGWALFFPGADEQLDPHLNLFE